MSGHRSTAENYFTVCVQEWQAADAECRRAMAIWHDACERLKRLAVKKNEAWAALEAARGRRKKRKRKKS